VLHAALHGAYLDPCVCTNFTYSPAVCSGATKYTSARLNAGWEAEICALAGHCEAHDRSTLCMRASKAQKVILRVRLGTQCKDYTPSSCHPQPCSRSKHKIKSKSKSKSKRKRKSKSTDSKGKSGKNSSSRGTKKRGLDFRGSGPGGTLKFIV
jgi:hypothetical protein